MKYILKIVFIFIFIQGGISFGQQLPSTNQFVINPYLISPAYAGYDNQSKIFLTYRKEWGDLSGGPKTAFVNAYFPASERVWLGGQVISDQTNISKIFYAQFSYTYHLPIGPKQQLYFGLWGSLIQNSVNINEAIVSDAEDPLLLSNDKLTGTSVNAGASLIFRIHDGNFGVTMPYLAKPKETYTVGSSNNLIVLEPQTIVHATYKLRVSYDWEVQPFIVYRSIKNTPAHYDLSVFGTYKERFWTGFNYRNDRKFGISLGGNLIKDLILNYTYEFATGGTIANPSPTHEIMIGFNLHGKNRYNSNRWMRLLNSQGYNNY